MTQDPRSRLRELGFTLPAERIMEIAQRLKNNERVLRIATDCRISRNTVKKVRDHLSQLEFLHLQIPKPLRLSEIGQINKTTEGTLPNENFDLLFDPTDASEVRSGLLSRFLDILPTLPKLDWHIGSIESFGIPQDIALKLLVERDQLFGRIRHLSTAQFVQKDEFVRLIELYYIVQYSSDESSRQFYRAPTGIIQLAARWHAEGLIDGNEYKLSAGQDLLRYQIWRGKEFVKAFEDSHESTHRAGKRQREILRRELDEVLEAHPPAQQTQEVLTYQSQRHGTRHGTLIAYEKPKESDSDG